MIIFMTKRKLKKLIHKELVKLINSSVNNQNQNQNQQEYPDTIVVKGFANGK
jgi:hemerythrin